MRIGEAAKRAGVSTKAVRYYESLGLVSVPRRANGYRDYDESHADLIREIHALGELGIRADNARPFLDCLIAGNSRGDDCSASLETYRDSIDELGARIAELSSRRNALIDLLARGTERTEPQCLFSVQEKA
jgi:DNA-binding transcriptional MerR regulator